MQIKYNEQTRVQGADVIAEGLGSARGHSLRIQYREQGEDKMAVLIDVQESGAQRRPGSPSGVQRQPGSQPGSQPGQGSDPGSQRSY
jgi:hypothetical protein